MGEVRAWMPTVDRRFDEQDSRIDELNRLVKDLHPSQGGSSSH